MTISWPRVKQFLLVFFVLMLSGCITAPPSLKKIVKFIDISELSLEEKVTQMFMIRYTGGYLHESSYTYQQIKRLVEQSGIGGIILFSGNIHGTIRNLNELQALSRVPLIVAADYERGVGQQLPSATLFPSNMALAATDSPELAYQQGKITALEARSIGVHVIFAPVMDVNSNPNNPIINFRSFGDSPGIVSRFGVQFIKGIQDYGAIATAKHFPGHGNTGVDSHTTLPIIDSQKESFEKVDLAPFRAAIDVGVKMIMVGHIAVPSLNKDRIPASLSNKLNGDMLRKELGFNGIIVTDAIEMGGITESFWAGEAAIRAIEAGSDIVLLPIDIDRAIESVIEAIKNGRISEERINESVNRILEAKKELGLWDKSGVSLEHVKSVVNQNAFRTVTSDIARKSITLVSDKAKLIPIPVESIKNPAHILLATDEGMLTFSRTFRSSVSRIQGKNKTKFYYSPLSENEIQKIVHEYQENDFILCSLWIRVRMNVGTVTIDRSFRKLITELQNSGKSVVIVSFGSPYVKDVEKINTYLCAYGYGIGSQYAMTDAIYGATSISGKLPVQLSPQFKQGHGLNRSKSRALIPSSISLDFSEARDVLESAIQDSIFPGAQVMVTKDGEILWSYQIGRYTYDPDSPLITENTIYDIASMTKVVATTPIVMRLLERKLLSLDEPVFHFFPEFSGGGKENVTIRHLLTHSSGLPPYIRFFELGIPPEEVIQTILDSDLEFNPGEGTAYSDLGMILLGAILKKVTGKPLDELSRKWIFQSLGMKRTFYTPDPNYIKEIAPTEIDSIYRNGLVQGIVHDENAWWLGGVAPHAGLFSTAGDLARYAQLMMNGGFFEGRRYFNQSTISGFTRRQSLPSGSTRALGWDTPSDSLSSAGEYFTSGSFGHLGFTGTSIWIDPNQRIAVVLLTNRVYPTRERGGICQVRRLFHNTVMRTILQTDKVSMLDVMPVYSPFGILDFSTPQIVDQ